MVRTVVASYTRLAFRDRSRSARVAAQDAISAMVSEMLTTSVMQHFDAELNAVNALKLFIPLVMSSGGNSGSQATSLITRAMALREVDLPDWWRVIARELPSGIMLGAILGVIGMTRIALWQWMFDHHIALTELSLSEALQMAGFDIEQAIAKFLPYTMSQGFKPPMWAAIRW